MWLSIRTVAGSCDRVMKLRISYNAENFLTSSGTISFSRRIVDYVVSYSVKGEKLLGFSRRIRLSTEFVSFVLFCIICLFVSLVGWLGGCFQYPLLAVTKPYFKLHPYIYLKLSKKDSLAVQVAMVLIRTSWITVRIP
jgi:hypothetical protein